MTDLVIERPKTLEEALLLIGDGVPLAGGSALTLQRTRLQRLIDLGALGWNEVHIDAGRLRIGSVARLQDLVQAAGVPQTLIEACRLEASWNIRNQATVGGAVMTADGRSPLLGVLLAMGGVAFLEPGGRELSIESLVDLRGAMVEPFLIREFTFDLPEPLIYEQVSRTRRDFPLVGVALAAWPDRMRAALCGFGPAPILFDSQQGAFEAADAEALGDMAEQAYRDAGDAFASADYRAHAAAVLVRRLVKEIAS